MNHKILLLIIYIFFIPITQARIYAPFGLASRQPPSARGLNIIDFEIGIEAQQVCGYTDWTTAQIKLPKQLLSKKYWKGIGKKIVEQATQAVIDLSGALPSMLACNASPSFCAVLNQAEMLASFENDLTFNTCKMLEGISNSSLVQSSGLKDCIQNVLDSGKIDTPGRAREYCLVENSSSPSKKDKNKTIQSHTNENDKFDMKKFILDLFPEKMRNHDNKDVFLNQGDFRYSRRKQSIELIQDIFPGITASSRSTVMRGGTFQPLLEIHESRENKQTEDAINSIIKEMIKWKKQQYSQEQIIEKSSHLWLNKKDWEAQERPHPIYRSSANESEPTFLIEPAQILSLLPLVEEGDDKLERSEGLKKAITRLSRTSTYIKLHDQLGDIYIRSLEQCKTNPKYQDAIGQQNCDLILKRTHANMEILNLQRNNEENIRKVQVEIQQFVEWEIKEQNKKNSSPQSLIQKRPTNSIWE